MIYEVEVRPGPNSGFFNYYTETVEASTSHDAVARVQRANPGCIVRCTKSYNKQRSSGGGSESSGIEGGGAIALIGLGVLAWLFMSFTPWILMLIGGTAGTWIGEKVTGQSVEEYTEREDDQGHMQAAIVLVLALVLGGIGFVKGTDMKKEFDKPSSPSIPAQVQQK